MLTLLEEELMRRLRDTAGLGLVRHTSSVIAATSAGGYRRTEGFSRCQQHSPDTAVQGTHRRHAEAAEQLLHPEDHFSSAMKPSTDTENSRNSWPKWAWSK
jgi:ATP-dependent protease ClpP protease subunit